MDTTECLGLPYPECNPPLTKDASDIEQFRDLAEATDAAVQAYDDQLTETLTAPPAAALTGGSNTAGTEVNQFYATLEFDNDNLFDSVFDGIRIQEDGWYMVGGSVRISGFAPTVTNLRVDPLLNGDPWSSRQGPGHAIQGTEDVCWADVGFFRAGDLLNTRTAHTGNPATVITYTHRIWIVQVLTNV
jgi:hypothetical protein